MLFTSRRTVETHRQNLLDKTGANNTATLILYAAPTACLISAAGCFGSIKYLP
jgi:DNA-binding NarL/FixJ family response regulator